jgi:3',5'-cyclic AMP phosphodiesterase CpdA
MMPPEPNESLHNSELTLRVAVLSDLHAYDDALDPTPPSYLCASSPADITTNPITGLEFLIQSARDIEADLFLCCGDLGDKAHPSAIRYVWEKLNSIKSLLGANHLFVTPGNHDVDSRYKYTDFDAKGFLQTLSPPYPFPIESDNDRFWSRNYLIKTTATYRIVILNSSAYHGHVIPRNGEFLPEFEHGRVADRTISALKRELEDLEASDPRHVNILLCHHHPHNHGDIEDNDRSLMEGANRLLELLGSGIVGEWIVIHGHKHRPQISSAASATGSNPIVFSAGSFSARPYAGIDVPMPNQFYVLEFPIDLAVSMQFGLVGTFRSWDWNFKSGWTLSTRSAGLPAKGGFGGRIPRPLLVNKLQAGYERIDQSNRSYVKWDELISLVPELAFVLPAELNIFIELLTAKHQFTVFRDGNGHPLQIAKRNE